MYGSTSTTRLIVIVTFEATHNLLGQRGQRQWPEQIRQRMVIPYVELVMQRSGKCDANKVRREHWQQDLIRQKDEQLTGRRFQPLNSTVTAEHKIDRVLIGTLFLPDFYFSKWKFPVYLSWIIYRLAEMIHFSNFSQLRSHILRRTFPRRPWNDETTLKISRILLTFDRI